MNPVDPLAQLNPLREPVAIGWWPLAPGWWLLIAIIAVGCALVAWRLMLRYRRNAYRRQGIATLNEIRNRWQNDGDTGACLTRTNALLKAVALRAYPQRDVASVTGDMPASLAISTIRIVLSSARGPAKRCAIST